MATWRCLSCAAEAVVDSGRPLFCPRCAAVGSFICPVTSPAKAPPRRGPVRAASLGAGLYGPGLGVTGRLARGTRNARQALDNFAAAASTVRNVRGRPAGQPGVGWQTDFYGANTVNAEAVRD